MFKIYNIYDFETFGILENWSLRGGDHNRKFNCNFCMFMAHNVHVLSIYSRLPIIDVHAVHGPENTENSTSYLHSLPH